MTTTAPKPLSDEHGPLVKSWIEHEYYGCDTGCCGHVVFAEDAQGNFMHVGGDNENEWEILISEVLCFVANEDFPNVPFSWEDSNAGYCGG